MPTVSLPDPSLLATTAQDTRDRAASLLATTTPPRPSADPCRVMQLHAEPERAVPGHAREVLSGRACTGEAGESAGDSNKIKGEPSIRLCGHHARHLVKSLGSPPLRAADTVVKSAATPAMELPSASHLADMRPQGRSAIRLRGRSGRSGPSGRQGIAVASHSLEPAVGPASAHEMAPSRANDECSASGAPSASTRTQPGIDHLLCPRDSSPGCA